MTSWQMVRVSYAYYRFEECLKALSTVKNSETKAVSLIGDVINAVENLSERYVY